MLQWTYGWELHKLDGLKCFQRKFVNKVPYTLDLLDSHRPFAVCPLCPQIFSIGLKFITTRSIRAHFLAKHKEETYDAFRVYKGIGRGQLFIKKMRLMAMKRANDYKRELVKKLQQKCLVYQRVILNLINEIDDSYGAAQEIKKDIESVNAALAKRGKNKKRKNKRRAKKKEVIKSK